MDWLAKIQELWVKLEHYKNSECVSTENEIKDAYRMLGHLTEKNNLELVLLNNKQKTIVKTIGKKPNEDAITLQ